MGRIGGIEHFYMGPGLPYADIQEKPNQTPTDNNLQVLGIGNSELACLDARDARLLLNRRYRVMAFQKRADPEALKALNIAKDNILNRIWRS